MLQIDETRIDLNARVLTASNETILLEAKAPSSKKFFSTLKKLEKQAEEKYGNESVPLGVAYSTALVAVYGKEIDYYVTNFTDSTLKQLNEFVLSALMDKKKE